MKTEEYSTNLRQAWLAASLINSMPLDEMITLADSEWIANGAKLWQDLEMLRALKVVKTALDKMGAVKP